MVDFLDVPKCHLVLQVPRIVTYLTNVIEEFVGFGWFVLSQYKVTSSGLLSWETTTRLNQVFSQQLLLSRDVLGISELWALYFALS